MAPTMVIPMLFRLDLYAGEPGHHAPPTEAAPSSATFAHRYATPSDPGSFAAPAGGSPPP